MENLGNTFFRTREERGIGYTQIWKDIRIREEQVKLIEANRFGDLGVYGVSKAIVYNYAKYLELDLNAVIAEFHRAMPEFSTDGYHAPGIEKGKSIMLSPNFLWMVGIVIFVIVLSIILLTAYQNGYLKSPEFNTKAKVKTGIVVTKEEETSAPDSLRNRMLKISETMAIPSSDKPRTNRSEKSPVLSDTTDYVGEQMGNSPINVEIK